VSVIDPTNSLICNPEEISALLILIDLQLISNLSFVYWFKLIYIII